MKSLYGALNLRHDKKKMSKSTKNWLQSYESRITGFIQELCQFERIPFREIAVYDFEDPESCRVTYTAEVSMNCDAESSMRYWDVLSVKTQDWIKSQKPKTRKALGLLSVSVDCLRSES